jgi:radical SAM protein with 4Fe4S-binding SPASM domain
VLSVLEAFEQMQGLRVLFSGGEPLLYPHLRALNETLPRYGIRKVLLTNGTLVTTKNYHDWCHFDEIQFSLDGLQKGHERLRGTGTFEQTLQGIEAAVEKGIPISIATMVHRYNLKEFDALAKWIDEQQVMEWNIDVPCAAGRLSENPDFFVALEESVPFLQYATGGSYHGSDEPFACGYHLCTVTPEGDVLKCGFYKDRPLGSLTEGLEVCWERVRPIPLSQLECASCPHLLDCKGGCRFRADTPLGKDPVMCTLYGMQGGLKTQRGGEMRRFDVRERADDSGEYILGAEDTGSHACYLIYGTMKPREKNRVLKPGRGHEELILAVKGDFLVTGHMHGTLKEGTAMHLKDDETCWLENTTDESGIYIISGGHAGGGHH